MKSFREERSHHFFCYAFQIYRGIYQIRRLFFSFLQLREAIDFMILSMVLYSFNGHGF